MSAINITNSKYVLCKFGICSMNHKEIKYRIFSAWNNMKCIYCGKKKNQMCKIKSGKKNMILFQYCLNKFMGKKILKINKSLFKCEQKNPHQSIALSLTLGFSWNQKFQWTLVLLVMGQHFCNIDIFNMNMKMVDYRAVIERWQRLLCTSLRY